MVELGRLALFAMGFRCLWALVGHERGIPFAAVRGRVSTEQELAERILARDKPMLGNLPSVPPEIVEVLPSRGRSRLVMFFVLSSLRDNDSMLLRYAVMC